MVEGDVSNINEAVKSVSGANVHCNNVTKKRATVSHRKTGSNKKQQNSRIKKDTVVTMSITDEEVHILTNFQGLQKLISYV
eukprot:11006002-Ditylum_brightwellii.AAC.1